MAKQPTTAVKKDRPVIQVTVSNECGRKRMYPQNEIGKQFTALLKRDTLNLDQCKIIASLGYDFEVLPEALKL